MKVGDKLYFVYYDRSCGYLEVVKVGRVWAYLSNGYRIDLKTLRSDGGNYSSPGRAWKSKEEYDASYAKDKLWLIFRILVREVKVDNDFTSKQIVKAAAALGIDLDEKGTQ